MPVQAMQTYQVTAPVATHYRPATCVEVDCDAHRYGWVTKVDESTADGQFLAGILRGACRPVSAPAVNGTRRYIESRDESGMTLFEFPAGQLCFRMEASSEAPHIVPLDRPENYLVRGGDWRQHLGVSRVHVSADEWVEDFAENQNRVIQRIERG
jgi:hypothetical protein